MNKKEFQSAKTLACDEQGLAFISTMMVVLMLGVLGVMALTMSGLGNSSAGALRMVEEGQAAAESCVGVGVDVIQRTIVPNGQTTVPAALLAPGGPVPVTQSASLWGEITRSPANSPDCPVANASCGLPAPNLTMVVNNYNINGDIDSLFGRNRPGTQGGVDVYYRIDCSATNAATGTTTRVIAVYDCVQGGASGLGVCFLHTI